MNEGGNKRKGKQEDIKQDRTKEGRKDAERRGDEGGITVKRKKRKRKKTMDGRRQE